jgi:hypothetical protein
MQLLRLPILFSALLLWKCGSVCLEEFKSEGKTYYFTNYQVPQISKLDSMVNEFPTLSCYPGTDLCSQTFHKNFEKSIRVVNLDSTLSGHITYVSESAFGDRWCITKYNKRKTGGCEIVMSFFYNGEITHINCNPQK